MKKIILTLTLLLSQQLYAFSFRFNLFPSKSIIINGQSRTYSDGSLATSCNNYKNNNTGFYKYSGDIGDGLYTIKYNAETVVVYCDMSTDDGGWTLAVKLGESHVSGMSTSAMNTSFLQNRNSVGIGVTYGKLSDAMINGIRSKTGLQDMVYRVEKQASSFNGASTVFAYQSGNCAFSQKTGIAIYNSYPSCRLFSSNYNDKLLKNPNSTWCNQNNIPVAYFCDGDNPARFVYVTGYLQHPNHNWVNYMLWVR